MTHLVHLHTAQDIFSEDEWACLVAKRAVAKPDLPFDGLHLGAAMVPAQSKQSVGLPDSGAKPRPEK